MAIYHLLPKVKLEITAKEWKIENLDNANHIAKLMSDKISFLIEQGWSQVSLGQSFSSAYQQIEREFEVMHSIYLNLTEMESMKVFYKLLDNFFSKEMVKKVQNTNLLEPKSNFYID